MNLNSYVQKRVLVTGHTGFKGVWLSALLHKLGCEVHGISLSPTETSKLMDLSPADLASETFLDLGVAGGLDEIIAKIRPDLIFHMAAQSLVLNSYLEPALTFRTNVMGTSHLLAASEKISSLQGIVVVTSDKVYENPELGVPFKESDPLGGKDPYSASKAAAEIITGAWLNVYKSNHRAIQVCTARSGNVIGGGDRAENRLVPDIVRNIKRNEELVLRNPNSIRPWQHVLDALWGYILIGEKILTGEKIATSYNFGPRDNSKLTVQSVAEILIKKSGSIIKVKIEPGNYPEAQTLLLDSTRAMVELLWDPKLSSDAAIAWTCEFEFPYEAHSNLEIMKAQISKFLEGVHE